MFGGQYFTRSISVPTKQSLQTRHLHHRSPPPLPFPRPFPTPLFPVLFPAPRRTTRARPDSLFPAPRPTTHARPDSLFQLRAAPPKPTQTPFSQSFSYARTRLPI